jgi:hypothetical protein
MWYGKDDPPMYHMDGRPCNDAARREGPIRSAAFDEGDRDVFRFLMDRIEELERRVAVLERKP